MQGDGRRSEPTQAGLSDIDRLIHEPARLAILSLLFVIESADFLFVMRQTGLTRGNLSSHVSRLEGAGYLAVEKRFKGRRPHTTLRMTSDGRFAFQQYRTQIEAVLLQHPGNANDNVT
jgi:DNA-binding transcriptional ArsR family regulator